MWVTAAIFLASILLKEIRYLVNISIYGETAVNIYLQLYNFKSKRKV
jgi:hypothetical protein